MKGVSTAGRNPVPPPTPKDFLSLLFSALYDARPKEPLPRHRYGSVAEAVSTLHGLLGFEAAEMAKFLLIETGQFNALERFPEKHPKAAILLRLAELADEFEYPNLAEYFRTEEMRTRHGYYDRRRKTAQEATR